MRSVLTVRQKMILGILNTKRGFTQGAYLASQLGVSDRTVRTDLQVLQEILSEYDIEIQSIRGKGYLLRTDRPELLQKLTYSPHSLMSQEERVREISMRLLRSDETVAYGDLEDDLFISRSTLESDLKEISRRYTQKKPEIRLIRHRNSVCFEPDERKKRMLMNLLCTQHWNYNYEAGMHIPDLPVSEELFREIQDAYEEMMKENRLHLSEQDHIRFLFSLAIAVSRILSGHALEDVSMNSLTGGHSGDAAPGCNTPSVPDLIRSLADKTQACSGAVFSENEIRALTDEFIQRLRLNGSLPPDPGTDPGRRELLTGIIRDVLEEADRENGLRLAEDRELSQQLLNSFLSWLGNPYYTGVQHFEVTRAIRGERPSAVRIAVLLAQRAEQTFSCAAGSNILMEQASYLADALRRETASRSGDGARIIFISHLHPGVSGYILAGIRDSFGNRVRIDGPCPPCEYGWMKKDACDFVISTTKLKKDPNCPPAIIISPPFNKLDGENVRYYLEEKETCMLFGRPSCRVSEICFPETFMLGGKQQDKEALCREAVPFLTERGILEDGDVPEKDSLFSTVCSEGLGLLFLRRRNVLRDTLVRMKLNKPLCEREVTAEYVYFLLLREDSDYVPLHALEHVTHVLRRIHMERKYWRAGEETDLRKAIAGLEIW